MENQTISADILWTDLYQDRVLPEQFKEQLEQGQIDVNHCFESGGMESYPLMHGLHRLHQIDALLEKERIEEKICILLDRGANPNQIVKNTEASLLHFAVQWRLVRATEKMIQNGANVNAKDFAGGTPLHWIAVERFDNPCEELLLKAGIDLEIQDINGFTPLHLAAEKGNQKQCERLILAGASLEIKNGLGWNAAKMAEFKRHQELAAWLRCEQERAILDQVSQDPGSQGNEKPLSVLEVKAYRQRL